MRLLGHVLHRFLGRIESDGECVRLDDQLRLYRNLLGRIDRVLRLGNDAQLREVPQEILLPRVSRLVLLGAVSGLLRLVEELVEDSEVDAGHPDGPRPLHRGAEHAALLYVLPFAGGEFERLWFGERR